MYKPEIEDLLTQHLSRVAAPEQLWAKIENPQAPTRMRVRHSRVRALVVAAVLIAVVVFQARRGSEQTITPRASKATLNATCLLCHTGA